jgi:hypothetical protein
VCLGVVKKLKQGVEFVQILFLSPEQVGDLASSSAGNP